MTVYNEVTTIGVILDNLAVSQLNHDVLTTLNRLVDTKLNICVFVKNISPSFADLKFGVFGLNHIHGVENGTIIATDLDSAAILSRSQTTAEKLFYVWELEWLLERKNFLENVSIYRSMPLYTRSKSYSDALFNYCNSHVRIEDIRDVIFNRGNH